MDIQAFHKEDGHTWLIILDDNLMYEMSRDAHSPNGVCIYVGPRGDDPHRFETVETWGVKVDELPIGIIRQIVRLHSLNVSRAASEALCYVDRSNSDGRRRAADFYVSRVLNGNSTETIEEIFARHEREEEERAEAVEANEARGRELRAERADANRASARAARGRELRERREAKS